MRRVNGITVSVLAALALAVAQRAVSAEPPQLTVRKTSDETVTAAPDLKQVANQIAELTNQYRLELKLAELTGEKHLSQAAGDFAVYMADNDRYGHTADGREPAERATAAEYDYCIIEENIGYLSTSKPPSAADLAQHFFDRWRDSAAHQKHLANPHTRQLAVAIAQSAKTGRYYAVQEFGRPESAAIRFEISNRTDSRLDYRLDDQDFSLEPLHGRKHMRPIPPRLDLPAGSGATGYQPKSGELFTVRNADSGKLAVDVAPAPESKPAAESKPTADAQR